MQGWLKTIAASRNQLVASPKNYRAIQASLFRLTDSIQLSIASSKSGVALQKLGQLKDGVNAAWETVLTVKADQHSSFVVDKTLSFVAHCNTASSFKMELRKGANTARRGDGAEQFVLFGEEAHARRSGRSS